MGPMGELGALFNPGMRHEQEEQRAKQMLREEEGTGRKGRLNIDLSSGTVVIGSDTAARQDASSGNGSAGDDRSATHDASPVNGSAARDGAASSEQDGAHSTAQDEAPAAARSEGPDAAKSEEPHVAPRRSSSAPSGKARRKAQGKTVAGAASRHHGR